MDPSPTKPIADGIPLPIDLLDKIAEALGAHVSEPLLKPVDGDEPKPLRAGRRPKG